MKIDEDLLLSYGAIYMDYAAKENIFFTGHYPRYYFQIVKGTVELSNVLEDGKEIILWCVSGRKQFGGIIIIYWSALSYECCGKNGLYGFKNKQDRFSQTIKA